MVDVQFVILATYLAMVLVILLQHQIVMEWILKAQQYVHHVQQDTIYLQMLVSHAAT